MGEAADDEFDRQLSRRFDYEDNEYQTGSFQWRTATGEVLNMRQMETSHLQNCLRFADGEKTREIQQVLRERMGLKTSTTPANEYEESYQDFLKRIGRG